MEQAAIKIHQVLENCFNSIDSDGKSYFVAIDYRRPISKKTKILKKDINNTLNRFLKKQKFFPEKYTVNKNISLQFLEATKIYKNKFLLGINHDFDSGGWLIELLVENTSFCVVEKSEKIKMYKSNYKDWWLLLVDHIGLNMMAREDYSELKYYSLERGSFNKVLIIDPISLKEIFSY